MNKEFDFGHVGKRMPYTTPDGFFANLEEDIWNEVKNDSREEGDSPAAMSETPQAGRKSKKMRIVMRSAIAAAASIVLLFAVGMNFFKSSEVTVNDVDQAFSQLTTDDQAYLLNVYQADIFIQE